MAFGSSSKTPPKATKPGQMRPVGKLNSKDASIEGNLRQLLSDQENEEATRKTEAVIDETADVDGPLVRLVNSLLVEAVKQNASDIHIEPFEGLLRIRYRIDGVLREIQKIPYKLTSSITSRLKIMADLDICEKRIPQDGSFKFRSSELEADFRISTLPATFGEKIVMRVMGATNVNNDLSKLGIPERELKIIRDAVSRPDGLVLVTGPTGSGKTTTLYAAINELNDISVSVFTAEDPVEGTIPGVTQCQVNSAIGYTFSSILRSLLRQDPDVILVGEIRDQETAEISIKASLTGHLVLSTLHTNCAISTISRLLNMGVAPYLITSSVNCVVAQRLVRKICEHCKVQITPPPELLEKLGSQAKLLDGGMMSYGKGCDACHQSGYKGRAPLYEVLSLSDELRRLILAEASKAELRRIARIQGMVTLREAGIRMVLSGLTTLDEVLGATNEDDEQIETLVATPAAQVATTEIVSISAQLPDIKPVLETSQITPQVAQVISNNTNQPEVTQKSEEDKAKEAAEKWRQLKNAKQTTTP
jgi:type IV pilus assembly protein PilB